MNFKSTKTTNLNYSRDQKALEKYPNKQNRVPKIV